MMESITRHFWQFNESQKTPPKQITQHASMQKHLQLCTSRLRGARVCAALRHRRARDWSTGQLDKTTCATSSVTSTATCHARAARLVSAIWTIHTRRRCPNAKLFVAASATGRQQQEETKTADQTQEAAATSLRAIPKTVNSAPTPSHHDARVARRKTIFGHCTARVPIGL